MAVEACVRPQYIPLTPLESKRSMWVSQLRNLTIDLSVSLIIYQSFGASEVMGAAILLHLDSLALISATTTAAAAAVAAAPPPSPHGGETSQE